MNIVCPQCNKEFLPIRKDQKYCSHSCRQQEYIKRKYGLVTKPVVPVVPQETVENKQISTEEKPLLEQFSGLFNGGAIAPETLNQLMTQLGQLLGLISAGAPLASLFPSVDNRKPVNDASAAVSENTSKAVNDGLMDKLQKDDLSAKNDTKAVNTHHKTKEDASTSLGGAMLETGLTHGLNVFNKDRNSGWTKENWKMVNLVNRKFLGIVNGLLEYGHYRSIEKSRLQWIVGELEEFHSGTYSVMLPENYPYFGFFRKLEQKLCEFLSRIPESEKTAELKIGSVMVNELLTVKVQIGQLNPSVSEKPP